MKHTAVSVEALMRVKPEDEARLTKEARQMTRRMTRQTVNRERTAKQDAAALRASIADTIYANSEPNV